MEEVDKRMEKLTAARSGIAGTEERIQRLYTQADEQLKALHAIAKVQTEKAPAPRTRVTPALRENVRKLKREGWTVEEIASSLKKPVDTINLILELPD